MNELFITNTITINARIEKVWDCLTNPDKTKIYMFGCETISDWKKGSTLLWQGNINGAPMVFVKGYIIDIEPFNKLVYSTFDPNSTMDDLIENYLNVRYQLEEDNEKTILVVTQGDYSKVAEGQRRYQESYNNGEGWNPILVEIKKLAESDFKQ